MPEEKHALTRRDYIAALALQSVIAGTNPECRLNSKNIVDEAVRYADALIAKLDEVPEEE